MLNQQINLAFHLIQFTLHVLNIWKAVELQVHCHLQALFYSLVRGVGFKTLITSADIILCTKHIPKYIFLCNWIMRYYCKLN